MASNQDRTDGSLPPLLRQLTNEQRDTLTQLLDQYLIGLENHETPDRQRLLDENPSLAVALNVYFDEVDQLHGAATGTLPGGQPLAGQRLGDYQLDQEIGRGGMGVVFSGIDLRLDRRVAVKLLPMAAFLPEKQIERFKNEARAAANLQHESIVPVYKIGEEGGIHYFSMRLIDGPSLDRRIAQHELDGTLPPVNRVLRQFARVADALHAAHEHGIVHRDIKPSNLLLDAQQKLWIADFGLARFQSGSSLTQTGDMVGTLRYMSPEQASGRNELVDHRTDVYSLGATLYELLTLQPAVPGEEGPALLRKIESYTPERLRKSRPDCPSDLQVVIDKAMSREKGDRYENAAALADDLRRVADGRPILARPVSPAVHLSRWASRHAAALAVTCSVLLLAAIGLATSVLLITRESELRQRNLENARRSVEELAEVADELALLPGGEQLRRKVLQRTLRYYQGFASQAENNGPLRLQTARAYSRMGSILEELGQPMEAVKQYQCAEAIYAMLVQLYPDEDRYASQRNENLNYLGLALSETGNTATAVETLEDAVVRWRSRASTATQPPTNLALSLNNYGLALQKANRRVAAKAAYEEAIELLSAAWDADEKNVEVTRGLAAALQNYGALMAKEDPSVSLTNLKAALGLQLKLSQEPLTRLKVSRDLISTYLHLGSLYLAESQLDEAENSFSTAAEIATQLVEISPQMASYRRDLAVILNNLGMTRYRKGNRPAALESLQQATDEYRTLLESYSENTRLRSSLGVTLNNLALVMQDLGRDVDADETYSTAASMLETAQLHHPTTGNRDALEQVYMNHSRLLYSAGRSDEAAALIERRTELVGSPLMRNVEGSN